jgi:hypothetical protein
LSLQKNFLTEIAIKKMLNKNNFEDFMKRITIFVMIALLLLALFAVGCKPAETKGQVDQVVESPTATPAEELEVGCSPEDCDSCESECDTEKEQCGACPGE